MRITHMSFSGGGFCGITYLGVIRYMQMEGYDIHVRSISGTSIGAFFACVLALGIPAGTMEHDLKTFFSDPKRVFFEASKLVRVLHDLGVDESVITVEPLVKYFESLWGTRNVTFLEFAKKTGKDLVICASCIETSSAEYFSVDNTPDVYVLDAIQASMTVPIVFKPVKIHDKHYIDGGVTDNHPVDCFGEKAKNTMLAVKIHIQNAPVANPFENLISYLCHMLQMSFRYWDRQWEKAKYAIVIDKAPICFMPLQFTKEGVNMVVSPEEIDASIEDGMSRAFALFNREEEEPHPSVQ